MKVLTNDASMQSFPEVFQISCEIPVILLHMGLHYVKCSKTMY